MQQRGSLHLHGLFWLENAPLFNLNDVNSFSKVIQLIDEYCSCDSDLLSDDHLKKVQTHNHSRSCLRQARGVETCRFKQPKPPMKQTVILLPFDKEISRAEIELYKLNFEKVVKLLDYLYHNCDDPIIEFSFEEFLNELDLSYDEYINAIRSSLKSETIFLKRKVKDIKINVFNLNILELNKGNMDIQFILNP